MHAQVAKFVSAKAVGSFVPKLTRKAFERYGFSLANLLTEWPEIAGADIAASAMPDRLVWPQDGGRRRAGGEVERRQAATLYLRVTPARALNVEYGQRTIIERINGYLGYRAVADLKIIQAPDLCGRVAGKSGSVSRAAPLPPPPAEVDAVAEAAVRDALMRLYTTLAFKGGAETADAGAALPRRAPAASTAVSDVEDLPEAPASVPQPPSRRSKSRPQAHCDPCGMTKRPATAPRAKAVARAGGLS